MDGKTRIAVARRLVRLAAVLTENAVSDVFGECVSFYESGKTIIEKVTELNNTLKKTNLDNYDGMKADIGAFINCLRVAPESVKVAFGTEAAVNNYNMYLGRLERAKSMKTDGDINGLKENGGKVMSFTEALQALLDYSTGYEQASRDAFNSRGVSDAESAREVLDLINDGLNDVNNNQ